MFENFYKHILIYGKAKNAKLKYSNEQPLPKFG